MDLLRFTALFNTEIFFRPVAPNCTDTMNVYIVTAEYAVDLGSGSLYGKPTATCLLQLTDVC